MKKLIYLVVVLAVAGGGYFYYESQKPPQVPEFMKATVSQGDVVEVVSATGTLRAQRLVVIGSKVSGVVEELNADFNDIVRAGQVLARINTDLLDTQGDPGSQHRAPAGRNREPARAAGAIGTRFEWWASTHSSGGTTYDYTKEAIWGSAVPIPEPSTMLLLGSGLLGLVGYGRRRMKK